GTKPEVRATAFPPLPLMGTDTAPKNFSRIAAQLSSGKDVSTSARAIRKLPREAWAKDQAAPLSDAILKWAKAVPAGKRTDQDVVGTSQAARDLATLWRAADGPRVRGERLVLGGSVAV